MFKKAILDPGILKKTTNQYQQPFFCIKYLGSCCSATDIHLTENNRLEYLQSANKHGHSTDTTLVKVQNDIFTSIDQHGIVILILLDLSAPCDTIDQEVLFFRMKSALCRSGLALNWFPSYLSDCTL